MNMGQKLALEEALEWINKTYRPIGIIVCGSIVRNTANANSDFDIQVIHEAPYRQRVQKFFYDVPFEIFVNHPDHILRNFEAELMVNRPTTAHMLATGIIMFSTQNNIVNYLVMEAKNYVNKSPKLNDVQLNARKYTTVTFLEDVTDVIDTDTATAQLLLSKIAEQIIDYVFALQQQPLPRIKDRLKILHDIDADTATSINAYYASGSVKEQYKIMHALVLRLTGHTSFYEWESGKE